MTLSRRILTLGKYLTWVSSSSCSQGWDLGSLASSTRIMSRRSCGGEWLSTEWTERKSADRSSWWKMMMTEAGSHFCCFRFSASSQKYLWHWGMSRVKSGTLKVRGREVFSVYIAYWRLERNLENVKKSRNNYFRSRGKESETHELKQYPLWAMALSASVIGTWKENDYSMHGKKKKKKREADRGEE